MVFLVVFRVENKEHDIYLQNILGNMAVVFQREWNISVAKSGFEYIYKKGQIGAPYSIKA